MPARKSAHVVPGGFEPLCDLDEARTVRRLDQAVKLGSSEGNRLGSVSVACFGDVVERFRSGR
jgi:hypothetical protein